MMRGQLAEAGNLMRRPKPRVRTSHAEPNQRVVKTGCTDEYAAYCCREGKTEDNGKGKLWRGEVRLGGYLWK